MPKTITTEDFVKRATAKHNGKYCYNKSEYISAKTKLEIICPQHGSFMMNPNNHLSGQGCPKCGLQILSKCFSLTTEQFIKKAKAIHGDTYEYSLVDYKKSQTKVKLVCSFHGVFEILPNGHLGGNGCDECAHEKLGLSRRKSLKEFLKQVKDFRGDLYEYTKTNYVTAKQKVIVTCRVHGDFKIRPNDFLWGSGCRKCAKNGYQVIKPGKLYVLQAGNITKVGITNRRVCDRAYKVSKTSGLSFEEILCWTSEDGQIPLDVETKILKGLRQQYKQPAEIFDGSTECFLNINKELLISRVNELITEAESQQRLEQAT